MCYINIHLTVNPFTFYTDCIIMQIIVDDCYRLSGKNVVKQSIFRYKLYKSVEDFAHSQGASKV